MGERIRRKAHSQAGFTLAETLMAVLIMLMVSGVVAGGIPLAQRAYTRVLDAANAQVLLSTTVTALRRELGTAGNIEINEDGEVLTYVSAKTGAYSALTQTEDGIQIQDYTQWGDLPNKESEPRLLVARTGGLGKLVAVYDEVTLTGDGLVVFENLRVVNARGTTLCGMDTLVIRPIVKDGASG